MIKNKTKIIIGLIGLFIFVFNIGFIFATSCFHTIPGVEIVEWGVEQGGSENEYRIQINQNVITDKNISFNLVTSLPPQCVNKKFILEIDNSVTFKLTGTNRYLEISGDINVIRFNSTAENGSFINFIVDNDETNPVLFNNAGPGILNIKIPKIEVTTKGGIIVTEGERSWIDNEGSVASSKRNGHGVKVILKEVVVNSQKDFNISVVATNPKSHFEKDGGIDACANNTTQHGIHGGVSELILDSIENYGNLNVVVKAADGSVGSRGCYKMSKTGGLGGNGGQAKIDVNTIKNYSSLDFNIYSGTGANGARGSDEGNCGGSPASGGSAGNGADLNYSFKKIFNNNSAKLNLSLNSGNGGTGGRAGYDRCQTDGKRAGGNGGFAGNINILEKTNIENKGKLDVFVLAGFGGQGGQGSRYRTTYRGKTGKSGSGGSISDYNFSNVINTVGSEFKLNLKSGKININPKKNADNQNRGTATSGSVGSINIDYLNNKSVNFEIITELNEKNINNLNSASCECSSPGSGCSTSGTDPTIGNIKIKYLASGSFLPKTLEIRKNAVLDSMPEIEISSCYLMSIGNSQLKYVADSLTLKGTNLETIVNDFNNSSKIDQYILIPEYCPVCDSLELDNPLRIDKEFSIFSTNHSDIIDLNIFYLDQNGNMFSPPGYISDQNYVVYSLKSGTEIESQGSLLFGEDIREYKLSKEKLHYNPLGLDLDQLEDSELNLNDIKLFCPGQRYQIVYKLQNGLTVTMPFTPLFNIR